MILRLLFFLFLSAQLFAGDFDPFMTSKANKAKQQAAEAFASNNYAVAISRYKYLLDTLKIKDDKAQLNLAHAYMRKADYANAQNFYTDATKAVDKKIRSVAYQQLGILQSEKKNKEEALANFKNALRNDPSNEQARYNYELLLKAKDKEMPKSDDKKQRDEQEKKDKEQEKKNEEQKKKEEQQKKDKGDKNQENKDKQDGKDGEKKDDKGEGGKKDNKDGKNDLKEKDKENKDGKPDDQKKDGKDGKKDEGNNEKKPSDEKKEGEGDKGKESKADEKGDKKGEAQKPSNKGDEKKKTQQEAVSVNKEQLQKMNMTEQQAKSILNAMRQGEAQYIQQMKRMPTKPRSDNGKKDW